MMLTNIVIVNKHKNKMDFNIFKSVRLFLQTNVFKEVGGV